ncbi:MAG TPA: alanine:cation symporter family protein, partial [Clostridia bacterium]|nr:alanine:cation symporter family protein [Clostridia bacterium]
TLAQVYKRKDGEHRYKGGPAYYIETALHSRALGIIFAISLILCFTYGFNGLQSYTLTSAFEIFVGNEVFNEGGGFTAFVGLILAALVSFFFFGGGKSSATISSVLVPIMAFGYLVVALIVIGMNLEKIPMIFTSHFMLSLINKICISNNCLRLLK